MVKIVKKTTETTVVKKDGEKAEVKPEEKPEKEPLVVVSATKLEKDPVKIPAAAAIVPPTVPPESPKVTPSASSAPVEKPTPVASWNPGYTWVLGLLLIVLAGVVLVLAWKNDQLARRKCPEVVAVAQQPAASISGASVPASECPQVISDRKDQFRVVWDCARRVWQDSLPPEGPSRTAYELSFTAPDVGGDAVFNGVNAVLLYNGDRDPKTPETVVAANMNGVPFKLVANGWYKVKCGSGNGGFEIKLSDPS